MISLNGQTSLECRVCSSSSVEPVFDLGNQPLANALLDSPDQPEESYPLVLCRCGDCGLMQLGFVPDPSVMFSHYSWVTGTSESTSRYLRGLTAGLAERVGGWADCKVLEVASNDGTLLRMIQAQGADVLGVDPAANLAAQATAAGIATLPDFFTSASAEQLAEERGPFDVAIARNVLPHVPDPGDLISGMARSIGPNGFIVIEFHWANEILRGLQYDSIYHEHACYLRLADVESMLSRVGFTVLDILPSPISGGSLVAIAARAGTSTAAVSEARSAERESGVNTAEAWHRFAQDASEHRDQTAEALSRYRGAPAVAFGASARSSTFLNYLSQVASPRIDALIESNPLKQGKFTPGTHVPIVSLPDGLAVEPQSCLLLAWNFADEIKQTMADAGFRGDTVIAFPAPTRVVQSA